LNLYRDLGVTAAGQHIRDPGFTIWCCAGHFGFYAPATSPDNRYGKGLELQVLARFDCGRTFALVLVCEEVKTAA